MGQFLRKLYQRFIRMRGHPLEMSLGFALGLFVGFSPTMGVQITNPLTAPVLYGFTYWLGARLMGFQKPMDLTFGLDWHNVVTVKAKKSAGR